jgi:hypothetical protein
VAEFHRDNPRSEELVKYIGKIVALKEKVSHPMRDVELGKKGGDMYAVLCLVVSEAGVCSTRKTQDIVRLGERTNSIDQSERIIRSAVPCGKKL